MLPMPWAFSLFTATYLLMWHLFHFQTDLLCLACIVIGSCAGLSPSASLTLLLLLHSLASLPSTAGRWSGTVTGLDGGGDRDMCVCEW